MTTPLPTRALASAPPALLPAIVAAAVTLVAATPAHAIPVARFAAPFVQGAQSRTDSTARDSTGRPIRRLEKVSVTATRTEKDVFETPMAVGVIDSTDLRERMPNTAVDLFRALPGVDVTGTGTNQTRPSIRGQRGQRVLLLEDGLRLNNSRRQQDFGELPALAGVDEVSRVEIVRGPASVLYGTDAIGGVVNLITSGLPAPGSDDGVHGRVGFRYGSAGDQQTPSASLFGRSGRFAFRASGAYREASSYRAPAGSFGDVSFDDDVKVNDSGVRDLSYNGSLGFDLTAQQRVFAKAERYEARNAGFGYLSGDALGADQPLIRIHYPEQQVDRYSVGYRGSSLGSVLADRFEVTAYAQRNERRLNFDLFVPFGPGTPPGAGVTSNSRNFTDLATTGMRAEASKIVAGRHLLTYGVDYFRDRSENTDSSRSVVSGFGPPRITIRNTPQVPNATFRSAGAFAQGDLRLADRVALIVGGRLQDVKAETRETARITGPLFESHERTAVGTANLLVRATDDLHLIASAGRAFRAPNLVERFFDGPVTESGAYQVRNTDLDPETSLNVEGGVRYRRSGFFGEAFAFRNDIRDGIRAEATGDSIDRLPIFQNVNVDRLRVTGVEVAAGTRLLDALDLSASFTRLRSKNVGTDSPVGDTYSSKVALDLGYRPTGGRFYAAYGVRRNGQQKDIVAGVSPVGDVLPAFTVHSVRGGILLFDRGGIRNSLSLAVENLTNELYAEFANAGFFRPEPKRNVTVSLTTEF